LGSISCLGQVRFLTTTHFPARLPVFFRGPLSPINLLVWAPTLKLKTNPRLSPIYVRHLPMTFPPAKTPPFPQGCHHRALLSQQALLPQIHEHIPGDLSNQMRWFFLEVMCLDVLYGISKIQLEFSPEVTRILFASAAAHCSGSNQLTPW
jgi:hypothetical protein